ncbi:MAG: hypothetical protein IT285_14995 [Bdellovibrionales bacterium]|nr:hypothetical protein [Bdellovibrionales bacterium]
MRFPVSPAPSLRRRVAAVLVAMFLTLAPWNLSRGEGECPVFALIEEGSDGLFAARRRVMDLPSAHPLRNRMLAQLSAEQARLDAALDALANGNRVNTGELERLRARVGAWEDVANGPPVRYVNPGHHGGVPDLAPIKGKAQIPTDHARLWERAIPEPGSGGTTWWTFDGTEFHRFMGGIEGGFRVVHWNGTTAAAAKAIRVNDVPGEIRRFLAGR